MKPKRLGVVLNKDVDVTIYIEDWRSRIKAIIGIILGKDITYKITNAIGHKGYYENH